MKAKLLVITLVVLLVGLLPVSASIASAQTPVPRQEADWDVPNGHFFTQTGHERFDGYSVTDDVNVPFWSEFKRLGGVQAVGYPVSGRFEWNGFVCQSFQRVVFQWQPDARQVSFVNVFDLMHDTGKDAWLKTARQTPEPKQWQEAGLGWDQVVANRLKVMDAFPEIKKAFLGVQGDPIQMNGLPTTDVVDMGNNYTLRAQRVVIQQWKEDVPWAKKGQVTFGLGGQIAKEAGLLPLPFAATMPHELATLDNGKWRAVVPIYPRRVQDTQILLTLSGAPGRTGAIAIQTRDSGYTSIDDLEAVIRSSQFAAALGRMLTNFKMESITRSYLGGQPAVRIVYSGDLEGTAVRAMEAIAVHEDRIISVALTAEPAGFDGYLASADWIASQIVRLK